MLTNTRKISVEWGDCDPAGIVYYPRYFEWFDAATAALFAAAGVSNGVMHKHYRILGIPMVDTRARFFIPSKFEDELTVESTIIEFRRSSFDVLHRMLKNGELAVEGFETRVWTVRDDRDPERLRSEPIPAEVKARFQDVYQDRISRCISRQKRELMADIATPELRHVADLVVRIAEPMEIGRIAGNLRRVILIAGGEVRGPRLSGRVLPGGADFQIMRVDGVTDLHARYVIEVEGGQLIYVENSGVRFGPPELMEKIRRGEPVDPALIYFRSTPRFETAAPGYEWLMQNLFVCSGARFPDRVELRFFQVT